MIILGLDPSLSCTGWGIIRVEGSRISHIANGQIKTDAKAPLPDRLASRRLYEMYQGEGERTQDDRDCRRNIRLRQGSKQLLKQRSAKDSLLKSGQWQRCQKSAEKLGSAG